MSPLGLGIALVLLVIIYSATREKKENYVRGRIVSNSADGVKFVGSFEGDDNCNGTDEYCRGVESFDIGTTLGPVQPQFGSIVARTQNSMDNLRIVAQSAITRVGRVMGGQPAGSNESFQTNTTGTFDQFKENFQLNHDVAVGTQWAGEMNRLAIP